MVPSLEATPNKRDVIFYQLLCKQGVAGSIPATSTKALQNERVSDFCFGAHLRMCVNCAGKDRNGPLCTITRACKPLTFRNAFGQSEAQNGEIAA